MSSRVPPLLLPYIQRTNPGALTLITSVLGASSNWLILCYLAAALGEVKPNLAHTRGYSRGDDASDAHEVKDDFAVALVSWMRDWEFWKSEARRSVGLDLTRLKNEGRIIFIDGLTSTLSDSSSSSQSPQSSPLGQNTSANTATARHGLTTRPIPPLSQSAGFARGPQTPQERDNDTSSSQASLSTISRVHKTISDAIEGLLRSSNTPANRKVILIFDTPSMLLETYPQVPENITVAPSANEFTRQTRRLDSLHDLITHLRSTYLKLLSTVVSVCADDALLAPAQNLVSAQHRIYRGGSNSEFYKVAKETPLEIQTAAFVVGLAHQAQCVLQCRRLDTGWAEDISGVIRVSRGGAVYGDDYDEVENYSNGSDADAMGQKLPSANGTTARNQDLKEGEWLYHIGGDGSAKVWNRGSGVN